MKSRTHLLSILALAFAFFAAVLLPSRAEAATNVYYSVGQNTSDHKTGSPTVTISSGVATFSVAQTATNMGIGDKVTYNGSSVAYISGKISTTQWNVITATGGTPANVTGQTVNSIAHAFASLNAAVGGLGSGATDSSHLNTANLVTGNYILNIPCYYDSGADTGGSFFLRDYTTSATNYLRIYTPTSTTAEVNQSQRHSGVWSSTKYHLTYTDGAGFTIYNNQDYVTIDGLQVKVTSSTGSSNHAILVTGQTSGNNRIQFSNNIIVGVYSAGSNGHGVVSQDANNKAYFYNNIIYGFNGSGSFAGISSYGTTVAYNNTLYGNGRGLNQDSGPAIIAKNNIAYSNTSGGDYVGTFSSVSTGNVSKDATAPAFNSFYRNKTLSFTSLASSSEDFHLVAGDTDAIGKGANLSTDPDGHISFSTDIDGQTRTSTWDAGADYYLDVVAPIISSIASSTSDSTATITWTTNESATSSVEYGPTASYGSASTSQATVTSHSITLTGLTSSTLYHFRVSATDGSGNRAVSSDLTFTTAIRATPPLRSAGAPSSNQPSGTTSTTISLTTDENATCKYSTTAGTAYASMTNTFSTTGGMSHSTLVSGLSDGRAYHYYVRCQDAVPNTNGDDYEITFRVIDSGTVYAESTSYAHVNAAVAVAGTGDTVVVPAGSSVWSSAVEITRPMTITGSGTTTTMLTASGTMPNGFFYIHDIGTTTAPVAWVSTPVRISGFFFEMTNWTPQYAIRLLNLAIDNLRIDHNAFNHGGVAQLSLSGAKGVIDSNHFYNGNKAMNYTAGSRDQADESWLSMAAGTSDALFIENNYFIDDANYSTTTASEKIGTDNGGKLVIRYNTFDSLNYPLSITFTPILTHGSASGGCSGSGYWQTATGTPCRRGQSVVEIYNNVMKGKRIDFPATLRGSANLVYNNTITRTGGFPASFYMYEEEQWVPQWTPLRVSWPAEDQVHNTFFWNNTDNGASMDDDAHISIGAESTSFIQKDRDFFLHAPQATGGSEIFTCANGFTACNGSTNTFPTDGVNYRTFGTMSFTAAGANAYYGYTPYTCPNPITALTGGCNSSVSGVAGYGVASSPAVTTSAASSVTQTTATLNGSITDIGVGNATVRGFAYGTTAGLTTGVSTTTASGSFGAGAFTYAASSLTCNTTYYVRAYATNASGTGFGTIQSFTTSPCVPTVSTDAASSIAATTATLNGTISATGGSNATARGFAYGTASDLSTVIATTTASGSFSTGAYTASISSLTCNTTYYVRAYATNPAGTSFGSIVSFLTSPCVQTVTTSAASSITQTTATLNATIAATGGANATQSGFAYGTTAGLTTGVSTSTLGAQTGTATFSSGITSLTCNTTYYARAYTTNSAGTAFGSIQSFLTSPCAPTVTTQAASSLTNSSATGNGNITATGGEAPSTRGFAYGLTTTYGATTTESGSFTTGAYTGSITGLACNTLYHVRAYAINSGGVSSGSDQTFTTSACSAPTVSSAAASALAKTTATLSGSITSTGGQNSTQAGFNYGLSSDLSTAIATTTLGSQTGAASFSSDLTGLTCETTYYFRAYATNPTGTSFGSILSFATPSCADAVALRSSGSSAARIAANLAARVTSMFSPDSAPSSAPAAPSTLSQFVETMIRIGLIPSDKAEQARLAVAAQPSTASFSRNLQLHDKGSDVSSLQRVLISKGYLAAGNDSGVFGAKTMAALKAYQAAKGVPATGYFGPLTRATVQAGN